MHEMRAMCNAKALNENVLRCGLPAAIGESLLAFIHCCFWATL